MTTTLSAPVADAERDTSFGDELRTVEMVWQRELIRYTRTRVRILTGLIQPLLFLFVLGYGMGGLVGTTGGFDFKKFVFPGIVAMSVVTTAIFSAISIVWDREFGFLREMLVAPISRSSLAMGKIAGGGTVASAQGTIMLALAPLIGLRLTVITRLNPLTYAVGPLRQVVFAAQRMPRAAVARFGAGVTISGYTLPLWLDVAVVVAFLACFFVLAIRGLARSE